VKVFWKVYLPLSLCLIVTIIVLGWVAIKVVPAQIREFQRQTIVDFRDALLREHVMSLPRAKAIADSLDIQAQFIPVGELPDGHPPEAPPGHVIFPATRGFPFVTDVSTFPMRRGPFRNIITYLLLLLLVEGAVLYLALRPLHKRINRLTWTADQFGSGNLGSRIPVRERGGDQIDFLGRTFNKMTERIESLVNSHHDLLGSVAHELRTPLARMELALELIRDNPDSTEEKLDRMEKDLRSLDKLVSELLAFNKLTRLDSVDHIELDLAQLCSEISQTETWGRPDIEISLEGEASCSGDRALIARAIGNLIRNAVRYASSRVVVTSTSEGEQRVVTVSDDGPGFDSTILERAGEPFVRGPGSKGSGLGLAIATRIAELHGGSLQFCKGSMGGAVVKLVLPA